MSGKATPTPFVPEGAHLVRARMMTGSMFPLVPEGTQLIFQKQGPYRPGDLVVFQHARGWICHRVVSRAKGKVLTWGDWSRAPDSPHDETSLAGRCVMLVRKGVVIDLDWPLLRWGNRGAALLLPLLKRIILGRQEGGMGIGKSRG